MTNQQKIKTAEGVAAVFADMDKSKIPTTVDGSIDLKKFGDVPEVQACLQVLELAGIDGGWLFKNGFVAAGMLLGGFLKKAK